MSPMSFTQQEHGPGILKAEKKSQLLTPAVALVPALLPHCFDIPQALMGACLNPFFFPALIPSPLNLVVAAVTKAY